MRTGCTQAQGGRCDVRRCRGIGDRFEKRRPVGDMDMFKEAAAEEIGAGKTEKVIASGADKLTGAVAGVMHDQIASHLIDGTIIV